MKIKLFFISCYINPIFLSVRFGLCLVPERLKETEKLSKENDFLMFSIYLKILKKIKYKKIKFSSLATWLLRDDETEIFVDQTSFHLSL